MATNQANKPTVCASWISPGEVGHEFASSMLSTMMRHSKNKDRIVRGQVSIQSGPRIAEARSKVVEHFLRTDNNWLWMVDADMLWTNTALESLLEVADVDQAPIVGGLCFGGRADAPMFPTIYELTRDNGKLGFRSIEDYPRDQVIQVGATGAAFLLVHRRVFEEMAEAFGLLASGEVNPYPWFVEVADGGYAFGEDISFCIKANALDIPIYVDTSVKIGHVKSRILSEESFDAQVRATRVTAEATTQPSKLVLPGK